MKSASIQIIALGFDLLRDEPGYGEARYEIGFGNALNVDSTLYPICVAHPHDHMSADQVVAVSGRLIWTKGMIGSVADPLAGMSPMARFDNNGVFCLIAGAWPPTAAASCDNQTAARYSG